MENIIDFLVILFFVISFFSSIFKKKKSAQKQINPLRNVPTTESTQRDLKTDKPQTSSKRQSSFNEILKSILEVPQPVQETKSEVDAYYEEAMRKSAQIETEKAEVETLISRRKQVEDELKVNIDSYTEKLKEIEKKNLNAKATKIRKELKSTSAIKEYIIMNEILSKPIALRE